MQRRIALFSTTLMLALLSGSNAMGYYGGGEVIGPTGGAALTTVRGTLYATVGPTFVITLKRKSGKVVSQIKNGTWKVIVDDKSSVHNFHLTGPGAVNKTTTVSQIVKTTWTVKFFAGTYTFKCDPHPVMKKTFKVINA